MNEVDKLLEENAQSINKINMLQAQLVQQEKMAEIGQLSAGIAHEINNPLGYIQSNMETLKKYTVKLKGFYKLIEDIIECSSDLDLIRVKEYISKNKLSFIYDDLEDIIGESMKGLLRIEKIVKSLLIFSRRSDEHEFVEYNINNGIRDTLTIANNEIKYYAKINENLEDVPYIMAIDAEINQVLLNIIVNASHAIREKGGNGTISIHTYHKNDYVYCEISDDGIGIKEENLSHIFEPFFTTKPAGIGTGLGLSIVHNIIENKHSGSINVYSEVGKGTTFKICLPLNKKA